MATFLDRIADRLERLSVLDAPSDAIAGVLRKVIRPGPVEDTLTGRPIEHPVHPLLVAIPIGAWTSSLMLDAVGADAVATRRLVAIGNLAALPTAATGASDWISTSGAERRVGLVHALCNYSALALQTASWLARRRGARGRGVAWSAAGMVLVSAGGWLGGHLTYALGVSVDTTAFQKLPAEWTDAGAVDDVGAGPHMSEVDGVPILLFRAGGHLIAMADRCTHRGGPLHEGELRDDCITCPWHGSVFAADGSVRHGPATRPEPTLQVRVEGGRIMVRRDEVRSLRMNPVGH